MEPLKRQIPRKQHSFSLASASQRQSCFPGVTESAKLKTISDPLPEWSVRCPRTESSLKARTSFSFLKAPDYFQGRGFASPSLQGQELRVVPAVYWEPSCSCDFTKLAASHWGGDPLHTHARTHSPTLQKRLGSCSMAKPLQTFIGQDQPYHAELGSNSEWERFKNPGTLGEIPPVPTSAPPYPSYTWHII